MNDRSVVMVSATVGAVLGGVAGFLFFTERGHRARRAIEPQLRQLLSDASSLNDTVARLRARATEGLGTIRHVMNQVPEGRAPQQGDGDRTPSSRPH